MAAGDALQHAPHLGWRRVEEPNAPMLEITYTYPARTFAARPSTSSMAASTSASFARRSAAPAASPLASSLARADSTWDRSLSSRAFSRSNSLRALSSSRCRSRSARTRSFSSSAFARWSEVRRSSFTRISRYGRLTRMSIVLPSRSIVCAVLSSRSIADWSL